jgi:hypothetical protein
MSDAELDLTVRLLGILRRLAIAANNIPLLVMADDACERRDPVDVDAAVELYCQLYSPTELYAAVAKETGRKLGGDTWSQH